jgi:hypothetical protein
MCIKSLYFKLKKDINSSIKCFVNWNYYMQIYTIITVQGNINFLGIKIKFGWDLIEIKFGKHF